MKISIGNRYNCFIFDKSKYLHIMFKLKQKKLKYIFSRNLKTETKASYCIQTSFIHFFFLDKFLMPSIRPSMDTYSPLDTQSVNPCIHLSIYLSSHGFIHLSVHLFFRYSIHPSVRPCNKIKQKYL